MRARVQAPAWLGRAASAPRAARPPLRQGSAGRVLHWQPAAAAAPVAAPAPATAHRARRAAVPPQGPQGHTHAAAGVVHVHPDQPAAAPAVHLRHGPGRDRLGPGHEPRKLGVLRHADAAADQVRGAGRELQRCRAAGRQGCPSRGGAGRAAAAAAPPSPRPPPRHLPRRRRRRRRARRPQERPPARARPAHPAGAVRDAVHAARRLHAVCAGAHLLWHGHVRVCAVRAHGLHHAGQLRGGAPGGRRGGRDGRRARAEGVGRSACARALGAGRELWCAVGARAWPWAAAAAAAAAALLRRRPLSQRPPRPGAPPLSPVPCPSRRCG